MTVSNPTDPTDMAVAKFKKINHQTQQKPTDGLSAGEMGNQTCGFTEDLII
jgi:hypothetical protein